MLPLGSRFSWDELQRGRGFLTIIWSIFANKTLFRLIRYYRPRLVQLRRLNVVVTSAKSMNVLGVEFNSKLNWNIHTACAISKAKKSLFALRLLRNYFSPTEMRTLLDTNFYSVLYCNAVIWLTPSLSSEMKQQHIVDSDVYDEASIILDYVEDCLFCLKQQLLSVSVYALRCCIGNSSEVSFENFHLLNKKCMPKQIMLYQMAINLYKLLNDHDYSLNFEHVTIMEQIVCTSRQRYFQIIWNWRCKIGLNTTVNKLYPLNNLIPLDVLNLNFIHYKKLMKVRFLKYDKT